jgi:glycosyltransferase involved in cell wall biosynthesis
MRIGLLTTSFPRGEGDIPGLFVLGFARALAARGHRIEVLAPEPHEPSYEKPPRFEGIEVSWLHYAPRGLERTFYGAGVLDNLRRDPRAWLGLAPFVAVLVREARARVARWDALISHWALPCAIAAGLARGTRPHLSVMHSADVFLLERLPGKKQLAAQIGRGASALVCSSRNLRERFLAQVDPLERIELASRTHVCAMGIEPLAPRKKSSQPPRTGPLLIASLGRLVPIKGLEHAIEAVARVPDVELAIAGDGPERGQLERLARRFDAPVRFLGELHGAAKSELLERAHAFVLPSVELGSGRSEGMPTTLLEALDHGLPVVASRTGGVTDVIEHEHNGLIVPPGDSVALAAAIERLKDPALRRSLSLEGKRTARRYHWPALAPHFEALLRG